MADNPEYSSATFNIWASGIISSVDDNPRALIVPCHFLSKASDWGDTEYNHVDYYAYLWWDYGLTPPFAWEQLFNANYTLLSVTYLDADKNPLPGNHWAEPIGVDGNGLVHIKTRFLWYVDQEVFYIRFTPNVYTWHPDIGIDNQVKAMITSASITNIWFYNLCDEPSTNFPSVTLNATIESSGGGGD